MRSSRLSYIYNKKYSRNRILRKKQIKSADVHRRSASADENEHSCLEIADTEMQYLKVNDNNPRSGSDDKIGHSTACYRESEHEIERSNSNIVARMPNIVPHEVLDDGTDGLMESEHEIERSSSNIVDRIPNIVPHEVLDDGTDSRYDRNSTSDASSVHFKIDTGYCDEEISNPPEAASERLHSSLSITKPEIMFILMNIFLRHNLTNAALCDLLKMVNLIVGFKSIPETYAAFSAFFSHGKYDRHYVCDRCDLYIGNTKQQCKNCKDSNASFFITFDFISNLRDVLTRNWNAIVKYRNESKVSEKVTDIVNAGVVRARNLKNAVTLTLNTDGVKVFNSNVKKSLWPLIICINDLPPKLRFLRKNVIIPGLWLANSEPNLDVFLKPLNKILQILHCDGLDLDLQKIDTVHVVACCVDSKARCKIQNFKQFNGYDACGFCLHPGDISKKQIRYGYKENVQNRNLLDTLRAMAISSFRNIPVNGVKGISPLIAIPDFDIIRNCPVDYMHELLLGVCRQLCRVWFENPHHSSYIKGQINRIDDMLLKIDRFNECSRSARKVSDRNSWKANEWLQWFLHYSLVCLKDCLPQIFYDNFYILVSAVTMLLQKEISQSTFKKCEQMIQSFVEQFEKLYGIDEMTYNVHLLLHLTKCSEDYGPLWAFSLFVFEDVNGLLKKYVKGPKEPLIQIANRIVMSHVRFNAQVDFMQPNVKHFWNEINEKQQTNIDRQEYFYLDRSIINKYNNRDKFTKLQKIEVNDFLYRPKLQVQAKSRHQRKSHNDCYFSIIEDAEPLFGEIHQILSDSTDSYFVFQPLDIEKINDHIYKAQMLEGIYFVKVNNSLSKYIKIQSDKAFYLSKLQYKLHID